jgi:hypothetical protein
VFLNVPPSQHTVLWVSIARGLPNNICTVVFLYIQGDSKF